MGQLVFCQVSYPNKAVIDRDTICQITIPQLKKINECFVRVEYLQSLNDTLEAEQEQFYDALSRGILIEQSLVRQINALEQQNKLLHGMVFDYEKEVEKKDKKLKWVKLQRTTFAITSVVLTGYVALRTFINNGFSVK